MTFQGLILKLSEFWASRGCALQQPLDVEVGAGTMHPETFLRVLGPGHWNVAYVQPARRPADGRFGENPNRLFKHHQFQVILKPAPDEVQQMYLDSLEACGINPRQHDIRFEEDNWESPTLGASIVDALAEGVPIEPLARYFEFWLLRLQGVYEPDAQLSAEAKAFLASVRTCTPFGLADVAVSRGVLHELERRHRELIVMHLEKELKSTRVLREMRHQGS